MSLLSGIEFVAVAIGLFGIGEVLSNVAKPSALLEGTVIVPRLKDLFPGLADLRRSAMAILRGTGIGFGCGLIPGPAPVIATYAAYMVEKRISEHPQEFGQGAIEGVAGPEAANNAACQSAFIPLFVLGIPFAPPTAILLGALLIHGVTPGPMMIAEQPELFWGVVASMYIGNFILLLLNLPFVPLFASILRVPKRILLPLVILFCITGMYSVNNSTFDIWTMLVFGGLGYLASQAGFEGAPLLLGLVLGPRMEVAFRQTLMISHGDFGIFFSRPISLAFLLATALFLLFPLIRLGLRTAEERRWPLGTDPPLDVNPVNRHFCPRGGLMSKIALMLAMVLSVSWGGPVCAAEFPTKEIQIIVPWAAGGATDLIFRAMGATAAKYLGKAVVVVNRPGGGGAVGFTDAMKARPDGYTLVTRRDPLVHPAAPDGYGLHVS